MRYLFTEDPQANSFRHRGRARHSVASYYANTDASLKLTTLITNTFINEAHALRAAQYRERTRHDAQYTPQSVGITPIVPQETQPPVMVILDAYSIGGTLAPYVGPATQIKYGDQISWSHGKHTIRAGGEYEADQWNLSFESLLRGFLFIARIRRLPRSAGRQAATSELAAVQLHHGNTLALRWARI